MMPFATLVDRDMPGDAASRLDRPGVFWLNLPLGTAGFTERFGLPPRELAARLAGYDFTVADEWLPHPVYGPQGWCAILVPATARRAEIESLARAAHDRAVRRQERRADLRPE